MTIFKHEVRSGLTGCVLWSAVIGGLMALCVSMYPSMSGSMDDFSAMFANMGDFSAAFGLDKLEFGSIMGFYGTECGNILGLGGAFYAALPAVRRELPHHFAPLRFAENWEDAVDYKPFEYLEVSEEGFALWQKAVQTHWFVTGSASFPYFEYYSHLKRLRGIEARRPYAETYMRLPEEVRLIGGL